MYRCRQLLLREVFGHQTRHVPQVLRGIGGADFKLAGRLYAPPFVEVPDEPERTDPALPAEQPGLQIHQQPLGARHQRRGVDYQRVELDLFVELFGQSEPVVVVGHAAARAVQRFEQRRAKAPGHAVTRQTQHVVPGAAADAREHAKVRTRGAERVHGQVGYATDGFAGRWIDRSQSTECY